MNNLLGPSRLRIITGVLLAAVFVFLGMKLIGEERTGLGAMLLAFAAFRGGLAVTQWNEARSQEADQSRSPPV